MKSSTRDILEMAWKTDEGSPVLPGQCSCTQVCGCDGCCVRGCGFELVDLPPYSPDLASFDYFLFPNMKKHLAGKHYRTDDEVISAV